MPHDAVTAYLGALQLLAPGDLGRRAAESPRIHAGRVGDRRFSLLAVDYALARYGRRALTRHEHERALQRWRALRIRLPSVRR